MKDFLLIFILLFAVADVSICAVNENIKIDMVGYLPSGSKYVVVTEKADNFAVKDVKTGKAVFFGQLKGPVADHDSGDDCYIGDFSGVTSPGEYNIEIMDKGSSYNFKIGSGIFTDVFYKVMRGFYLQRCGVEVSDKEGRGHGECHVKPALFHQTTGEQGTLDVSGGWHDAGDYGKYTVNSGISTATLLYMFERNRNKLQAFKLDIPADGRLPDVLAEAKYNIDWMMKMQNISGGVYHKVTPLRFPEMNKKPDEDSADQYIYEITSCATGDLAAVTALASRVYGPYDAAYAAKCLEAAERAWKFLDANRDIVPAGGFLNPADTNTGMYKDGYDKDERFWAATELYLATGKQEYHDYILNNYSTWNPAINGPAYWWEVSPLAMIAYVYSDRTDRDAGLVNKIKTDLINNADVLMGRIKESGYRYVLEEKDYIWGSNSIALNCAINLLAAYDTGSRSPEMKISAEKIRSYRQGAAEVLHYMLGRNPFNMSFVTGIGIKHVMHIHHRPSVSSGIAEPFPGLIAGGPNKWKNDDVLKQLPFDTRPARCYADATYSYASNEIAINWNAPLAYVLSYFIGGDGE